MKIFAVVERKNTTVDLHGVAILFDCAGGKLTAKMSEVISSVKVKSEHHKSLIAEVRKQWDFWDQRDIEQNDDCLQFDSFYHAQLHATILWMLPYFGCYQCTTTKKGLQALYMNSDDYIDWRSSLFM